MTVFKSFLKVLNKNKGVIILYTVLLIVFGALNFQTNENSTNFVEEKPDVLIINNDKETGITKSLINYIKENNNIVEIKNNEDSINDALFYRDVNYIIYIPNNFRNDFLSHKNPKVEIKSTNDYEATLAEKTLKRYLNVLSVYNNTFNNENEIIEKTNETLSKTVPIEISSKLDTNSLSRITSYYNFANYSILAGCVYVICLILSSFKEKNISKRTIISSINYKEYNRKLILSNSLFAFILWFFYVLLSFILLGSTMLTLHSLFYILNSFIFTICAVMIAFLIGNLVNNKSALNGIVNVVALGSSFLCGAFVPMDLLPEFVLKISHILPSYWYIKSNELIKNVEIFNIENLKPIMTNMIIILIFSIIFVIIANIVSNKKRKLAW